MFDYDDKGGVIVPAEFMLIEAFSNIKDKYKDKYKQVLAFIYFTQDFKSSYKRSEEESTIVEKVSKDLKLKLDVEEPTLKAAIDKYKELQNVKSLQLFEAADQAIDQVIKYFKDFNIDSLTDSEKNSAVYNMMKNLKEVGDLSNKLTEAKARVEQDIRNKSFTGKQVVRKRELPRTKRK